MYESPIEIIYDGIKTQFENNILKTIQHYEIQVDKDELIKALRYDRNQYEKGFKDGAEQKAKWIPCSERLPEETGLYLVSMDSLGYPQRIINGFICGKWERFGKHVLAWMPLPEPYKEADDEDSD